MPLLSIGQLQIDIKGGYIYYWFTSPSEPAHYSAQYDYSHNAFSIAVTIRQRSSHILNFGSEIEYVNRSFNVKSSWGGLGSGTMVDFSYTIGNIYIHFQPQFVFGSKLKFFFYPGFYLGTLLHSTLNGTLNSWSGGTPFVVNYDTIHGSAKGHYPDLEFGISPGIGLEFPICNKINFVFEYSFRMNLLPIGSSWGWKELKMFNMNFEVGIAYTFEMKNSKRLKK